MWQDTTRDTATTKVFVKLMLTNGYYSSLPCNTDSVVVPAPGLPADSMCSTSGIMALSAQPEVLQQVCQLYLKYNISDVKKNKKILIIIILIIIK